MTLACPCCGRAYQRWFVDDGLSLIRDDLHGRRLAVLHIVPDFGRQKFKSLTRRKYDAVTQQLVRILKSSGVTFAFGGSDFSVNTEKPKAYHHVQLHYVLITLDAATIDTQLLRSALNKSGRIRRPLQVTKSFDGNPAGLAYILKTEFFKRENYYYRRANGQRNRNTRTRKLHGKHYHEISVFLDIIGLASRIVLLLRRSKVCHLCRACALKPDGEHS